MELKFENKFELFKFLISQEGKELKVLAFDQRQILDKSRDAVSVQSVEEVGSVEKKDDQNNTVDVQREDAVVESEGFSVRFMLEEEIKGLRRELEAKDAVRERLRIQNKKMEQKYYELQLKMKKIGLIARQEEKEAAGGTPPVARGVRERRPGGGGEQ